MNLTQTIKEQAERQGFSLAGVTSPDSLLHEEVFKTWLDQGRHGEMAYMNTPRSRTSRAHPEHLLPGCRSVVVLGTHYPMPAQLELSTESTLYGRIASYAWGADYHEVFAVRLKNLLSSIEGFAGYPVPHRWYTDTGPVLERELAQRAGLGWIGKNTCLIHPARGSYYLLAEILLGAKLELDEPFQYDRCGTCHRCIDACPTHCILPDRTLDARHCISYLTIELKGAIPPDLRPQVGNWIFGCDICQQVCPWNRFTGTGADREFVPAIGLPGPMLIKELALTAQEFNQKYRQSPIRRTKRRGYLRNIAVALGNSHRPEAAPALEGVLKDESEPLVRAHAAWALGQIQGQSARRALDLALKREPDEAVKLEILSALEC
jgi:epoxyqueuosine reductase